MTALLTALLLAASIAPAGPAHYSSNKQLRDERHRPLSERQRAKRDCSQRNVLPCIKFASMKYGQDYGAMVRVARCESGLNPYARNPSGASGLFQFMPSTWQTTPYGHKSIWSARWQSLGAAWMHQQGRGNEWVCR